MTDADYPNRHRPTHPAPVERFNEPVIVQVNVCTKDRQQLLACEAGHRLCRDAWQAADFWRVGRYTIMPDHIHLFCAPGRVPTSSLRQWVEFWKSRIAARWPIDSDRPVSDGTEPVPPGNIPIRMPTDGTEPVPPGNIPICMPTDGTEPVPPGNGHTGIGRTSSVPSGLPRQPFKLWQRDFWDTQMRSREHYEEKLAYVRMNPVRKALARTPEEWPYQGVINELAWM
jgi:REP element-mobilizing transposase RayT